MITLFKESCLHVHANLRSPNFDTQNSTKTCGVYLASKQVWLNQILTPQNSPQTCGVYLASMQVWLNQILTPQNSTNMDFSIKMRVNILTFFILIQQLI